jgi:mono/diheme cytochrome c family protein
MVKALAVGLLLGVLLVIGSVWFYFTSGSAPVAVTDPPLPFEKKLANAALQAHVEKQGHKDPTAPADETNFLAGAEVYKQDCAVCHGLPGESQTVIAQGMFPKPPKLFEGTGVTDDPVWETYWKAENGIRLTGMPGFKGSLTEKQLWQVSQLLAHADKIPAAVKTALASNSATAPAPVIVAPPKK